MGNDGKQLYSTKAYNLDMILSVGYIKQHQEATIRRYKMALVVAFVVGIISGAVTIAYLLSTPATVPLFTFRVQAGWLSWLAANSRLLTATALSLLITLGLISIISNIQDIRSMRGEVGYGISSMFR